jgi:hypothetical protein
MPEKKKSKGFREVFSEAIVKQYLPFSIIEEKVIQDSHMAFLKEYTTGIKKEPSFVTGKTVAANVSKMADLYVTEMSKRFQSKLSLSMDAWTGPNKMYFLGITFNYLDENFHKQRGYKCRICVNQTKALLESCLKDVTRYFYRLTTPKPSKMYFRSSAGGIC